MDSKTSYMTDLTGRAEAGEANAQFELGVRHKNGAWVALDLDEAKSWLRKSADQGNGNAILTLVEILQIEKAPTATQEAIERLKSLKEDYLGGRRPWDGFDIFAPGASFLRDQANLLFLAGQNHEPAQLEITRRFLVHLRLLDPRSEGLAWWGMPVFGIAPSVLWIVNQESQPILETSTTFMALANFQRAQEWYSLRPS